MRGRSRAWTLITLSVALAGCQSPTAARKAPLPAWVTDPASLDAVYPKSRFFTGVGICAGPNCRDLMSRKQAENAALADIASVVELQIDDVVEQHDTEVVRNGRTLEQNVRLQNTRRVVTGLLGGAEVKETVFDDRALNWYALAVLERGRATRGALEAVDQRLADARQAFGACGVSAVEDLFTLRPLAATAAELDRLAVAVALFAPAEKAGVRSRVDAFKAELDRRLAGVRDRGVVRVTVQADGGAQPPELLRAGVERVLLERGLRVTGQSGGAQLRVALMLKSDSQVGAMRIYKVAAGARYELTEGGRTLFAGQFPMNEADAVRSGSLSISQQRSMEKMGEKLIAELAAKLDAKLGGKAE